MKQLLGLILLFSVLFSLFGTEEKKSQPPNPTPVKAISKQQAPSACDASTILTGKNHNLNSDEVYVRSGPGADFTKIINKKATAVLDGTHYITVDTSSQVYEECTKGEWSWIRTVKPDWLQASHRGWIASNFLDRDKPQSGKITYDTKISTSALTPYTTKDYPKTVKKFKSRLAELEVMRKTAAEMAIDSGKCDYVYMSEISDTRGSLQKMVFWVDCRNGERIYLSEDQITAKSKVATQKELAWNEAEAIKACKQGIKNRSLLPSKVDLHSILGTSTYKSDITQNLVVRMDFDAMNALGAEMPYTAKCYFEPGLLGNIELYSR